MKVLLEFRGDFREMMETFFKNVEKIDTRTIFEKRILPKFLKNISKISRIIAKNLKNYFIKF